MNNSFRNSYPEFPEKELQQVNQLPVEEEAQMNILYQDDFIIKDSVNIGSQNCSGQFIFKCSFNEKIWNRRDYLGNSADLSSPEYHEQKVKLVPLDVLPSSTLSLKIKKSVLQSEIKGNQRQEIPPIQRKEQYPKKVQKKKAIKKKSKASSFSMKKSKSKRNQKQKRDNNYVMKRSHTVLKKCCWSVDKNLRTITRQDADGSMDYFVRVLSRVEAVGHLHEVVQKYHEEAQAQIKKVQSEIEQEESLTEINHLRNVIAVLLKGKEAAYIFMSGERVQAMELMYGKGQTLKKVYKMEKAIEKLKTLLNELRLGGCENEATPDIWSIN